MRRRPALSVASISALVVAGLAVPLAGAPTARARRPAHGHARRVAAERARLPRRLAARLRGDRPRARSPGTTTYAATFAVPAGSYELKVAINHSWDESYGTAAAATSRSSSPAPATLRFTYDDTTHGRHRADRPARRRPRPPTRGSPPTPCATSRRSERFYFVMADRFANGDTANDQGGLDRRTARRPASTRRTRASTTAATSRA